MLGILEFINDYLVITLNIIALIFSILTYSKYFDTPLKQLPILLLYASLTEILGMLIKTNENFSIVFAKGFTHYNIAIYNVYDICIYLCYLFIYFQILKKHKKIAKQGAILFAVVSIFNLWAQDFLLSPQIFAMFTGSFFLSLCAILYLKQLIKSKHKRTLYYNLSFWFSIGILVFYPIYPIMAFIDVFFGRSVFLSLKLIEVFHISLCSMHLLLIIGFIKMRHLKAFLT